MVITLGFMLLSHFPRQNGVNAYIEIIELPRIITLVLKLRG